MEKYNEHKETNVFWQTMMPKHWCVMKLRYILRKLQREKKPNAELLVCSNSGRVNIKGDNKLGLVAEDDKIYQGVGKGDLLIHGMDTWHGAIAVSEYDGMCTPVVHVCDSTQNKSFIAYYLRNMAYEKVFKLISNGVRQNTSDFRCWDKLAVVPIILPPLAEQNSIVSYLDTKYSQLDTLLSNKEKEISLLQEMKQRVIADAVTRGINPSVKFKTTNIPWLPEIPEHWEMSKVSSHFRQRNMKVSDKEYPALSVSKMGVTPQLDNVALSNAEGNSRKLVKIGDYAVNSRSDRKGSCGVSQYEGSVSLITIVLEPFDIDRGYVHYLFRSNPWIEEFYRNGRGIVADLWTTNYQMMKGMYLPVPPHSEQRSIVSYITERASKIDLLIEKLNKEIECIKEYKQRLISDVVTGQVKVC